MNIFRLTGDLSHLAAIIILLLKMEDQVLRWSVQTLQSLHILAFEKERLEKKILHYKQTQRQPPNELLDQHRDVVQRFQWQKSYLEQGGSAARKEYVIQLERFLQLYTEAVRRLSQEGKRDAAKEALHKRNLVENELQKFRR